MSEWVCVLTMMKQIELAEPSRAKEVKKYTAFMLRIEKVIGEQMLLCFRVHKEASNTHTHADSPACQTVPLSHQTHNNNPNEMKKYGRKVQ